MVTQELVSYIQGELNKGVNRNALVADLTSKGWQQSDIESVISQLSSQIPASASPVGVPQDGQAVYVATIPVEKPSSHPGQIEGILSIVCAIVAFFFAAVVFGTVGIILGVRSYMKGAKVIGVISIGLSALFLALGVLDMVFGSWIKQHAG